MWRILDALELKPHRVRYYLARRDAQFERKMAKVLVVYRDVNLYCADATLSARLRPIYTVSVDEKPGVQALGISRADLPPGCRQAPRHRKRPRICSSWHPVNPRGAGFAQR